MSADWSLCIDFGTAFSKAAIAPANSWSQFDPGGVRPLAINAWDGGGSPFLLDSAVFVDDDGVLFGRAALERGDELRGQKRAALRSFKTLLSADDLDRALNTNAPRSVDPYRVFPMRDLLVLYLAYLLAAVEAGIADASLEGAAFDRRYAAPAWHDSDGARRHLRIVRLFGEAEALRRATGDAILSPAGLSFDIINRALPRALEAPSPFEIGLIFEATAAAAYTSIGLENSASHLIVVDMGAGTTDITAMVRTRSGIQELADARITLQQAGDHIDRVVANVVIAKTPSARSPEQQGDLWRTLMPHMRDIKESLFIDGRAMIRAADDRAISLTMRDIERTGDFRDFNDALGREYERSFAVLAAHAARAKAKVIDAVAVGGGASAPFIQDLLHWAPPRAGNVDIVPRPATPEWAHAPEFRGNLTPVFPQLAIAIGGALAPVAMLAAQPASIPVAAVRAEKRAARD